MMDVSIDVDVAMIVLIILVVVLGRVFADNAFHGLALTKVIFNLIQLLLEIVFIMLVFVLLILLLGSPSKLAYDCIDRLSWLL